MKNNSTDHEDDSQSDLLKKPDNINQTKDVHTLDNPISPTDQEAKKKKIIKWGIIGSIIAVAVILAIVLPITLSKKNKDPDNPPTPAPLVDYNPYEVDETKLVTTAYGFEGVISAGAATESQQHQQVLQSLFANEQQNKLGINLNDLPLGTNNVFSKNLRFSMKMIKWRIAHFTLTDDDDADRYEVPTESVDKPDDDQSMRLDMLGFSYSTKPFGFSFTDPQDSENVFVQTTDKTLFFSDKYIQMDFVLPSQRVFGFGERVHEFQLNEGTWTMWASGQNSPYDDGTGRYGLYGVHPFILVQGKNKDDFFGMYFRNSNAQSPVIKFQEDGTTLLSYITLGGKIDVYFFIHGTAKEVIQAYQSYFGKPRLPPFWSLGWQQASYKWSNQEMVQDVIDKYAENGFPLDTIYLDIPYMDNYQDFTVDKKNFPNLKTLADNLHKNNQRLVLIIDAGISAEDVSDKNKYYTQGNKDNVFIKSGQYQSEKYNNNLILKVWPQQAVFVDWFNPKCKDLWNLGLTDLYEQVHYDGIWLDMNEPTGFEHGEIKPVDAKPLTQEEEPKIQQPRFLLQDENVNFKWYRTFKQDSKSTFFLPFVPQYDRENTGNFDNMTASLNATHADGKTEYDLHNLYGHMMAKTTYDVLTSDKNANKDNRPFILTRSTFTSSGKYASHWLGDNFRDWDYLKYSIPGIMNMNMFGVPHVGADICGFFGDKRDDELCARWTQLATFYPLARFHYELNSDANEPYLMEEPYKSIALRAMLDRYQYLRHMYTCLFEASKNGGSCIDPLLYYFPKDENVYTDIDSTFMVGGALKVTPILTQLKEEDTTFKAYFPSGKWVNVADPTEIIDTREKGGDTVELKTTRKSVNVHLKQGSMIAFQDNSDGSIKSVDSLIAEPIQLLVNRDDNGYAYGTVFLDNGSSLDELNNENYEYYQLHFQSNSIQNLLDAGKLGSQNDKVLSQVKIFDAADLDKQITWACYLDRDMKPHAMIKDFIKEHNAVTLTPDEGLLSFSQFHSIHFGGENDVNICDSTQFTYKVVGDLPDLSASIATFELEPVSNPLPNIMMTMRVMEGGIVNIKWTWKGQPENKRVPVEVPEDIVTTKDIPEMKDAKLSDYLTVTETPQFSISLYSRTGPTTYFSITGLLYDEYLNWINVEATTMITGDDFTGVFGLGERANKDFFYKDGVYSMWSRDSLTPDETGTVPGQNMYGTHPFFMYKHKQSSWVGVFYKLAQAQDWWIKNNKDTGKIQIKTIAPGGVADIYVMVDTTPESVVQKYFSLVGRPVLTPQWALGWNQCRWGYASLDELKEVVKKYEENKLPLDVMWSDIDYLNKYRNFEYDTVNFKDLPDFIDNTLHKKNMRFVPIIDAGIASRPNEKEDPYKAYNDGIAKDVFMKINGEVFIGQVWPNDAVFPDYYAKETVGWWQGYLTELHNKIKFDGLWEDMNEAANFCNGVCYQRQQPAEPVKQKLKYIPTGRDLEVKSLPLDAQHANGQIQLDTHSIYGTQMVKTTHEWFVKQGKRTFIIERSSMAGMGKFASRWLGDNFSNEQQMAYSVSGIMLMNIFGITLSGSDICGFIGDTTWELCTKWHVVGSFYPFSRNHNNWGAAPQEPWQFKGHKTADGTDVVEIMREAIKRKYSLVRYYYATMFDISTQVANQYATLYKPLFFEFPDDTNAYKDIVYNVMLGDSLKLSINPQSLAEKTHDYYFPAGLWCSILSTDDTAKVGDCFTSVGETRTYKSDLKDFQLHLRAGKIIPMQDTSNKDFSTTVDLQSMGVDLHILGEPSDANGWSALGQYINDDGLSLNYEKVYNYYELSAQQTGDTIKVVFDQQKNAEGQTFSNIEGCTAVNQNDFLERIFFYNAKDFKIDAKFDVKAILVTDQTQTPVDVGTAAVDENNRLVFAVKYGDANSLCMSTIQELQFIKAA